MLNIKNFSARFWVAVCLCLLYFVNTEVALADNISSSNQSAAKTVKSPTNSEKFSTLMRKDFALTPDQIQALKKVLAVHQQAASVAPGVSLQGVSRTLLQSADPSQEVNSTPQLLRTTYGHLSTIMFTDKEGKPWPIDKIFVGDPKEFSVQVISASTALIQPNGAFGMTNLVVKLKGLVTTINLNLVSGQKKWDYNDRIKIQAYLNGDSQEPHSISQAPIYLEDFINGAVPHAAMLQKTDVGSAYVQVYAYLKHYIVVTKKDSTLTSPAASSFNSGMNGDSMTRTYVIPPTPYLIVSHDGQDMTISVDGSDD